MEENVKKLVNVIKQQAELFIIEGGGFYPFGSCVDNIDKVKPIGAYLEGNNPSASDLIAMLETHIKKGLDTGEFKLGAVAVDVTVKENEQPYDALELRLFKSIDSIEKLYYKYQIKGKQVEFTS